MARPVSWLPRLPAMLRAVGSSVRSHYSCADLQDLFEVQPRTAQMLLKMLPTVRVSNAVLLEREALVSFLERLASAPDSAQELAKLRTQRKHLPARRTLRTLVTKDVDAKLSALPENVSLEPGVLVIRFASIDEMAVSLMQIAALLEADLEGFASLYEPSQSSNSTYSEQDELEKADAEYIRQWMREQS